ncbi:CD99 antigen [Plasmodium fragile]|uniref:CD99 antigen n=1 Tax=Plasmodium fragile TaxID=5857 RepID=A0A0D9QG51_PLAFR|nr:CD99 antigen [Plasmodium fragile]KJP85782.1 CD99 antigen [Plasmodium fragile]
MKTVYEEFVTYMETTDQDTPHGQLCQEAEQRHAPRQITAGDRVLCELMLRALHFKHRSHMFSAGLGEGRTKVADTISTPEYMRCMIVNVFMNDILGEACLQTHGATYAFDAAEGLLTTSEGAGGNEACDRVNFANTQVAGGNLRDAMITWLGQKKIQWGDTQAAGIFSSRCSAWTHQGKDNTGHNNQAVYAEEIKAEVTGRIRNVQDNIDKNEDEIKQNVLEKIKQMQSSTSSTGHITPAAAAATPVATTAAATTKDKNAEGTSNHKKEDSSQDTPGEEQCQEGNSHTKASGTEKHANSLVTVERGTHKYEGQQPTCATIKELERLQKSMDAGHKSKADRDGDDVVDGGNDDPPPLNPPTNPQPNTNRDQSGSSGSFSDADLADGVSGGERKGAVTIGSPSPVKKEDHCTKRDGEHDCDLKLAVPFEPTINLSDGHFGTGPTPGPTGNPPHNVEHGGRFFPDLTADVFTATAPVLFFLAAVTVALLGYSLWKYFAYLAKRRRTYRTVRDVPSPPLDEEILQHLQRRELPPPDYGYTMSRDTRPASATERRGQRPPRVHKRTIIELHLEVLHECEATAWENVKDDYLQIVLQEFAHDLEPDAHGHSSSTVCAANRESSTDDSSNHDSTTRDSCPPNDPDPWRCMETIQLATDRSQPNEDNPWSCMENIQFPTDPCPPTEDDPWSCMETIQFETDPSASNEDNPDPWNCMENIQLATDPCAPHAHDPDPCTCMHTIQLATDPCAPNADDPVPATHTPTCADPKPEITPPPGSGNAVTDTHTCDHPQPDITDIPTHDIVPDIPTCEDPKPEITDIPTRDTVTDIPTRAPPASAITPHTVTHDTITHMPTCADPVTDIPTCDDPKPEITQHTLTSDTVTDTPTTLHPLSQFLHRDCTIKSCTPNPEPLNPEPSRLNPEPSRLNPAPSRLHPEP